MHEVSRFSHFVTSHLSALTPPFTLSHQPCSCHAIDRYSKNASRAWRFDLPLCSAPKHSGDVIMDEGRIVMRKLLITSPSIARCLLHRPRLPDGKKPRNLVVEKQLRSFHATTKRSDRNGNHSPATDGTRVYAGCPSVGSTRSFLTGAKRRMILTRVSAYHEWIGGSGARGGALFSHSHPQDGQLLGFRCSTEQRMPISSSGRRSLSDGVAGLSTNKHVTTKKTCD